MNIKSLCLAGTLLVSVGVSSEAEHGALHTENEGNVGHANLALFSPDNTFTQNIANQTEEQNTQQQNVNVEAYEPNLITIPVANAQYDPAQNQHTNVMPFLVQIVNGKLYLLQGLELGTNAPLYLQIDVPGITDPNADEQNSNVTEHESAVITGQAVNDQVNDNDPAHVPNANTIESSGQNQDNNQQGNYTANNLNNDMGKMQL